MFVRLFDNHFINLATATVVNFTRYESGRIELVRIRCIDGHEYTSKFDDVRSTSENYRRAERVIEWAERQV